MSAARFNRLLCRGFFLRHRRTGDPGSGYPTIETEFGKKASLAVGKTCPGGFDTCHDAALAFRLQQGDGAVLDNPIARIEGLRVEFETKDGPVVGVEDVSFEIAPGETVCIVGESGSGKSVSSLSLMRLVEFGGGEIAAGRLIFDRKDGGNLDLAGAEQDLMRHIRGNEIGMIFQEPMTALNPVFTVGRQLTEGLRVHMGMNRARPRPARWSC